MILYFSATGNSRWVAERLAEATSDEAQDIAVFLKQGTSPDMSVVTDRVGIVYPIHSWYVPRPLVSFLESLCLPEGIYRYAVCTCGDDAGKGMSRLARHFPLDAAWSVFMPNTYIPMFELDSEEDAAGKIRATDIRIRQIAADVLGCRRVWDVHEGGFPWLKTYFINPLFVHFSIRTRTFLVDEGCISCGKCVKACLLSNITLIDGKPVWGHTCMHCMACIHVCPKEVIQYGKSTRKKGRYRLQHFLSR